jgi:uracil-DNA glycosylase
MVDLSQLPTCTKCVLSKTRTNVVVGKGNPQAKIMFIGEAPGANEDLQGKPFVGSAGKELDKLLHRIGLSIDDVYIANILKCRPPENRPPQIEEIKTCTPYLVEQICQIKPVIICTLGNYSTKFVLAQCEPDNMKKIAGITSLHGKQQGVLFRGMDFIVVPLYHPAAMLYNPHLRPEMETDFDTLGKILKVPPKQKAQMSLDTF